MTLHNPLIRVQSISCEPCSAGPFALPETGGWMEVNSRWQPDFGTGLVHGEQRYVEYDGDNRVVKEVTLPMTFALIGREEIEALAQSVGLRRVHLFGDYAAQPFDSDRPPQVIFVFRPT